MFPTGFACLQRAELKGTQEAGSCNWKWMIATKPSPPLSVCHSIALPWYGPFKIWCWILIQQWWLCCVRHGLGPRNPQFPELPFSLGKNWAFVSDKALAADETGLPPAKGQAAASGLRQVARKAWQREKNSPWLSDWRADNIACSMNQNGGITLKPFGGLFIFIFFCQGIAALRRCGLAMQWGQASRVPVQQKHLIYGCREVQPAAPMACQGQVRGPQDIRLSLSASLPVWKPLWSSWHW